MMFRLFWKNILKGITPAKSHHIYAQSVISNKAQNMKLLAVLLSKLFPAFVTTILLHELTLTKLIKNRTSLLMTVWPILRVITNINSVSSPLTLIV